MRASLAVVALLLAASFALPAEAGRRKATTKRTPRAPAKPAPSTPTTEALVGGPYSLVSLQGGQLRLVRPIYFQLSAPIILPASFEPLYELARVLKANPLLRVRIEGHTDGRGASAYNKQISQQRAIAVRDFLVQQGVAAPRLEAVGVGKDQPIDTNLTEAGRLRNRRIDFVVVERGSGSRGTSAGGSGGGGGGGGGTSTASSATAAARAHFARGVKHFQAGQYADALSAFNAAVASEPKAALHYNIGICHEKLGRTDDAIAAYRRYLSSQPQGTIAAEVRDRIAKLRSAQP